MSSLIYDTHTQTHQRTFLVSGHEANKLACILALFSFAKLFRCKKKLLRFLLGLFLFCRSHKNKNMKKGEARKDRSVGVHIYVFFLFLLPSILSLRLGATPRKNVLLVGR